MNELQKANQRIIHRFPTNTALNILKRYPCQQLGLFCHRQNCRKDLPGDLSSARAWQIGWTNGWKPIKARTKECGTATIGSRSWIWWSWTTRFANPPSVNSNHTPPTTSSKSSKKPLNVDLRFGFGQFIEIIEPYAPRCLKITLFNLTFYKLRVSRKKSWVLSTG